MARPGGVFVNYFVTRWTRPHSVEDGTPLRNLPQQTTA
jgi:hypothetical protein